jgi:hypothetical protein
MAAWRWSRKPAPTPDPAIGAKADEDALAERLDDELRDLD